MRLGNEIYSTQPGPEKNINKEKFLGRVSFSLDHDPRVVPGFIGYFLVFYCVAGYLKSLGVVSLAVIIVQ